MIRTVQESNTLETLCKRCVDEHLSASEKCILLTENKECSRLLKENPEAGEFFKGLNPELRVVAYSLLAIGQGHLFPKANFSLGQVIALLKSVEQVEEFYLDVGGILGYQLAVLMRLKEETPAKEEVRYLRPNGIDLAKDSKLLHRYIREAIEKSALVAEVYPLGGAGDRMNLLDKKTGEPLPVATLSFCGFTLLERLFRDLEAREYLVYKLTGEKIATPVAMMTSYEKRNHELIHEKLMRKNWYQRPKSSFIFFIQPQVPVVDTEGNWLLKAPCELIFKPGGHGAIWAQSIHEGVFDALKTQGIQKILVRQLNNPIAGTDYGLLAFLGVGLKNDKAFGFASCERIVNANEGMDVIVEKKVGNEWRYALTNIEYTEFKRKSIEDTPRKEGSLYSIFPANTNILFADIQEVESACNACKIPGLTINMKTKFKAFGPEGNLKEVLGGRLESTMQNIADGMGSTFSKPIIDEEQLKTYLTYNERIKTISVTKKARNGLDLLETPEGCLSDMMKNAEDLLVNYCGFQVPSQDFIFLYTPKLGPLYEIIRKKVRSGKLSTGSELIIEVPEVDIEVFDLDGSLIVEGHAESTCFLKNVRVRNKGLGGKIDLSYWEDPQRLESLHVILEEGAQFEAENVVFDGPFEIRVPKNMKATAFTENGKVDIRQTPVSQKWIWEYAFDEEDRIRLVKGFIEIPCAM